jgi:uncharacterized coiled-coil DUF342 family protein
MAIDETILTAMQLEIREIKTLLIERKEKLDKNAGDIGRSFDAIRKVNEVVLTQTMSIAQLEKCVQTIKDVAEKTEERLKKLEKWHSSMRWLSPFASAIITAAAIKFFTG